MVGGVLVGVVRSPAEVGSTVSVGGTEIELGDPRVGRQAASQTSAKSKYLFFIILNSRNLTDQYRHNRPIIQFHGSYS